MKNKIYLLLILFLSFIFIGEVKAENSNGQIVFNNPYLSSPNATLGSLIQQDNTRYFDFKPNVQYSNVRINFDELTIPRHTDYFLIPFSILNKTNDIYFGCSIEDSTSQELTQFDFTTTYADGTEAQNEGSATTSGIFKYCRQFRTDNDNITINVSFTYTDNVGVNCNVLGNDKEMLAMCPITSGRSDGTKKIKNFVINVSSNETSNFSTYSIRIPNNTFIVKYDSNAQMIDQQQQTNTKLDNIDTSINSSNTSGGESAADDLKNNSAFQDNTGLTSIVTAPLSMINSLTSSCTPIRLPIPYLDTTIELPCIGDLLSSKMGELIQLVKVVINGYICYLIGLDMFKIVKHAKDPNDDRIEVLDL